VWLNSRQLGKSGHGRTSRVGRPTRPTCSSSFQSSSSRVGSKGGRPSVGSNRRGFSGLWECRTNRIPNGNWRNQPAPTILQGPSWGAYLNASCLERIPPLWNMSPLSERHGDAPASARMFKQMFAESFKRYAELLTRC